MEKMGVRSGFSYERSKKTIFSSSFFFFFFFSQITDPDNVGIRKRGERIPLNFRRRVSLYFS